MEKLEIINVMGKYIREGYCSGIRAKIYDKRFNGQVLTDVMEVLTAKHAGDGLSKQAIRELDVIELLRECESFTICESESAEYRCILIIETATHKVHVYIPEKECAPKSIKQKKVV